MAEAVGIGKLGKNGLIFNSDYGTALMLGGVISTSELTSFSFPEKDQAGCPDDCFICQEVCPAGAITGKGKVDRSSCAGYSMESPFLPLLFEQKGLSKEKITNLFNVACVDENSMYKCTKCVSECPFLKL